MSAEKQIQTPDMFDTVSRKLSLVITNIEFGAGTQTFRSRNANSTSHYSQITSFELGCLLLSPSLIPTNFSKFVSNATNRLSRTSPPSTKEDLSGSGGETRIGSLLSPSSQGFYGEIILLCRRYVWKVCGACSDYCAIHKYRPCVWWHW